jgi:hypothetical protein
MNKKLVSISLGAGLIVGSAAGLIAVPAVSGAQSTSSTTATTPANRPDPSVRLNETLKPLVDAGTITQAQADAVVAALKAGMPERGEHGRGGKGGAGVEVAAQALGMTADELHTALKGGQTLAQIAESKGVDVQVVVDALVASATNQINEKVASGELTQAEADEKLANVTDRVTERVNNPRPEGGPRGGQGAKRGPAGQKPAAPATN